MPPWLFTGCKTNPASRKWQFAEVAGGRGGWLFFELAWTCLACTGPEFPSSEPQIEVIDDGRGLVADGIPVLGCEVAGGEISIWPPKSSLKWNWNFKGWQDLESHFAPIAGTEVTRCTVVD